MSFGIRIWGEDGALQLDENSFTVRVVYSGLVPRSGSGRSVDIVVPGVVPLNHSAVCVPVSGYPTDAQFYSAIGFTASIGAGFVRVYFGNPNSGPVGTTTQRLIVTRYR